MLMGDVRAEQLMREIDPEIVKSFTPAQDSAIRAAANRNPWNQHPVDLRVSLPLPFGRWYITLVAGPEKRSLARIRQERRKHPLATPRNLALLGATLGLMALGVVQLLAQGGLL